MTCEKCNKELEIGAWPWCPHEKGTYKVVGDECDIWIRHGLCHEDGSPKHFTSKQAITREAKAKGLTNMVRHVTEPGTDKSKHTTRWI
jgi:hypothetical protein